jgi:hypothetical protein
VRAGTVSLQTGGGAVLLGGEVKADCADDSVHGASVSIAGGSIDIATSQEGIEGAAIDIIGGDIRLTAATAALGSAGMAQNFDETSTLHSVLVNLQGAPPTPPMD